MTTEEQPTLPEGQQAQLAPTPSAHEAVSDDGNTLLSAASSTTAASALADGTSRTVSPESTADSVVTLISEVAAVYSKVKRTGDDLEGCMQDVNMLTPQDCGGYDLEVVQENARRAAKKHRTAIAEMGKTHKKVFAEIQQQHQHTIEELKQEHQSALAEMHQARQTVSAELQPQHQDTIEELEQVHASALEEMQRKHQIAFEEIGQEHRVALEEQQQEHCVALEKQQQEHRVALAQQHEAQRAAFDDSTSKYKELNEALWREMFESVGQFPTEGLRGSHDINIEFLAEVNKVPRFTFTAAGIKEGMGTLARLFRRNTTLFDTASSDGKRRRIYALRLRGGPHVNRWLNHSFTSDLAAWDHGWAQLQHSLEYEARQHK